MFTDVDIEAITNQNLKVKIALQSKLPQPRTLATPYLVKSTFVSTPKLVVSGARTATTGRTTAYGHRSNYLTTEDYDS